MPSQFNCLNNLIVWFKGPKNRQDIIPVLGNSISNLRWCISTAARVAQDFAKTKWSSTRTRADRASSVALTATQTFSKYPSRSIVGNNNERAISFNTRLFCCIACNSNGEYKTHIKCVTESERYESKSTFTAKANKGEVKQTNWYEVGRSAAQQL